MTHIDDITDTMTYTITQKEYNTVVLYKISENRSSEKFECSVLTNGLPFGTICKYDTREQAIAWIRLMLGDYADCYRGVA